MCGGVPMPTHGIQCTACRKASHGYFVPFSLFSLSRSLFLAPTELSARTHTSREQRPLVLALSAPPAVERNQATAQPDHQRAAGGSRCAAQHLNTSS